MRSEHRRTALGVELCFDTALKKSRAQGLHAKTKREAPRKLVLSGVPSCAQLMFSPNCRCIVEVDQVHIRIGIADNASCLPLSSST